MYFPQSGESSVPLLQTKFFIPTQRSQRLERPRLFKRLDTGCPLTLVSAPAGFGKTTLVSDWLCVRQLPVGWLSLNPADSEPRRFLSYLAGAMDRALAGVGEGLTAMLGTSPLLPVETLLTPLINELSRRSAELVLVLDDYHVVEHPEIHAAVELLAERLPPGTRIVLTTRTEPPLSLPRLRTRDLLREIRAEDLRFNDAEIGTFLEKIMGLTVAPSQVATLAQRTEGWIAGLQLAALSLRGRGDIGAFVEGFTDTNRYVFDYLAEEVLAGLASASVDFLLAASVAERISGPLCDALTGRRDGQAQLEALEAENLFIVPLDDRRGWYRFHHLFRSFLEQQLEKRTTVDERHEFHRRASDWLYAENLVDEALRHALAARDQKRSLDLLEQHAGDLFRSGEVGSVMRWFDAIPSPWVNSRIELVIDRALALYLNFRWREMAECLELSERLFAESTDAPDTPALAARQAALESFLATAQAAPHRAIRLARQALNDLPKDDLLLCSSTTVNLASSLILTDAFEEARPVLRDAARWNRISGDFHLTVVTNHLEGQVELILGHLHSALEYYQRAGEQVVPHGMEAAPFASLLLVGEADVALEWGELDRAQQLAERAVELSEGVSPIVVGRGLITLAGVHRSRRDPAQASVVVRRLLRLIELVDLSAWELMGETLWARIWCLEMRHFNNEQAKSRLGRWVDERGLLQTGDLRSKLLPDLPKEAAILCAVRLLLARGDDVRALEILTELNTEAHSKGWRRAQIEILLLKSQALHNSPPEAHAALRRALELAAPGGYIQVIVDESPWIRSLLDQAPSTLLADLPAGFRSRLMSALALDREDAVSTLPEQLSARELEVLAAIAEGLSNAEAGRRLFIAPSTVKKHLENIYGKLGAHNRVEAIARCRSLGLLGGPDPAE